MNYILQEFNLTVCKYLRGFLLLFWFCVSVAFVFLSVFHMQPGCSDFLFPTSLSSEELPTTMAAVPFNISPPYRLKVVLSIIFTVNKNEIKIYTQ